MFFVLPGTRFLPAYKVGRDASVIVLSDSFFLFAVADNWDQAQIVWWTCQDKWDKFIYVARRSSILSVS